MSQPQVEGAGRVVGAHQGPVSARLRSAGRPVTCRTQSFWSHSGCSPQDRVQLGAQLLDRDVPVDVQHHGADDPAAVPRPSSRTDCARSTTRAAPGGVRPHRRSTTYVSVQLLDAAPLAVDDHDVVDAQRVAEGQLQPGEHIAQRRLGRDAGDDSRPRPRRPNSPAPKARTAGNVTSIDAAAMITTIAAQIRRMTSTWVRHAPGAYVARSPRRRSGALRRRPSRSKAAWMMSQVTEAISASDRAWWMTGPAWCSTRAGGMPVWAPATNATTKAGPTQRLTIGGASGQRDTSLLAQGPRRDLDDQQGRRDRDRRE